MFYSASLSLSPDSATHSKYSAYINPFRPTKYLTFHIHSQTQFMGSCFSSVASSNPTPTVKIIALDGSLNELSVPVPVSSVLGSPQSSMIICDSDSLNFDTNIIAMNPKSMLQLDHMYFVLPVEKLSYPLSGSAMAALAVKASTALARVSEKSGRRRRMKILPIEEMGGDGDVDGVERIFDEFSVSKVGKERGNRSLTSGVIRNRMELTTIDEGDE